MKANNPTSSREEPGDEVANNRQITVRKQIVVSEIIC